MRHSDSEVSLFFDRFHTQILTGLPHTDEDEVVLYALGCAGERNTNSRAVAALLEDDMAKAPGKTTAVVKLGDNFYPSGTKDNSEEAFSKFYEIFANKNHVNSYPVPYFAVLGNHCYAYHNANILNWTVGRTVAARQVQHTYEPKQKYHQHTLVKPESYFFGTNYAAIDQISQKWNMPSRAYVRQICFTNNDGRNVVCDLYFMDSNTYALDYLYLNRKDLVPQDQWNCQNQAQFFKDSYSGSKAVLKILFWHHPLETGGKRRTRNDRRVYLSKTMDEALTNLPKVNTPNEFFNQDTHCGLLKAILEDQGIAPDVIINAHDHWLSVTRLTLIERLGKTIIKKPCLQITSGAGGGKLQHLLHGDDEEKMPFFAEEHGVIKLTIFPDCDYQIDILSTLNKQWRFSSKAIDRIPAAPACNTYFERLRIITCACVTKFLYCCSQKMDKSIHYSHLHAAHAIRNLVTMLIPMEFNEARAAIMDLLKVFDKKDQNSLINDFMRAYMNEFELSPEIPFVGPVLHVIEQGYDGVALGELSYDEGDDNTDQLKLFQIKF